MLTLCSIVAGDGAKASGQQMVDTIGTLPTPTVIQAMKTHLILVIFCGVLILLGVIVLVVRAQDQDDI